MLITFVNGMNNTYELAHSNAQHIQSLCPHPMSIHGVYNNTNGPLLDLAEIGLLNYPGYSPATQDLLREKWTEFHEKNKNNPHAKILHFCHSQGAAHTKNALMGLPEKIRARVIAIAIAPAEVVPRELCYDSFNFASKRDFVPYGEILHASFRSDYLNEEERTALFQTVAVNHSQIIWLEPHETSGLFDLEHALQSPIFIEVIIEHIKEYILRNGEYK